MSLQSHQDRSPEAVPRKSSSVGRTFNLLAYLGEHPDGASLQRIARDLGMHAETLRPYLQTLTEWRKVFRDPSGLYHLDPEGPSPRAPHACEEEVQEILVDFVRRTGRDANLATLGPEGLHLLHFVSAADPNRPHRNINSDSAHATGAGHALLWGHPQAFLTRYFDRVGMKQFTPSTPRTVPELVPHLHPHGKRRFWTARGQFDPSRTCIAILAARRSSFTADRVALATTVASAEYHQAKDNLVNALLQCSGELQPVLGVSH